MSNNPRKAGRQQQSAELAWSRANTQGSIAAVHNQPYESNPYDRRTQPELHLAWSMGHNGMRARILLDKDQGVT